MPSINQLIALSGRRIAMMYPMIGNRQKLRRKARSVSTFPASRIENQMPDAILRIVRPKMTRASSRRRGEFSAAPGISIELAMEVMVPRPAHPTSTPYEEKNSLNAGARTVGSTSCP